ncbi:hypothetical protein Acor_61030 [Acrocarpospora corrugata]|uniref:Uncharacterized protein n=1 Tax=Acrocarpospora corrugata TaxID=35763 RepID=A0A5M3W4Q1_9ACTN|nr:hypothetical protein Acor_61030 [Acrocarpospora corrugata]
MAGEEDGVGEEVVEFGQVGGAAVGQVGVCFGADAAGDCGQFHQFGVGSLLAAEDDYRDRSGQEEVQAFLPGAAATEEAYHDEVGAVELGGKVVRS